MKINIELSEQVSGIVHPKRKECFKNSISALMILSYAGEANNATYVEGCVVLCGPSAHGWIERDGEIIDVSHWGRNRCHNKTPSDCSYFAGQKYSLGEIKAFVQEHEILPLPLFDLLKGEAKDKQAEAMKQGNESAGS